MLEYCTVTVNKSFSVKTNTNINIS